MSLRPPSTSPSPSPDFTNKVARQSLGPGSLNSNARGTPGLPPPSPRPGAGGASNARPTSELLGGSGGYQQTPEAEALDAWFENLQNYEATLEEMAAASLDVNFKEELSAIEQWFKVLSEAERTAALYSLLQHSTQVQIRFFITVLQQMARSDPMTALLSPAMGSMQSQMEAKLASLSLKSPGLKSNMPASPTTRSFGAGNRQSLVIDSPPSNFLSPDSAATGTSDAAATLAQQRAKFKASNAAHRISAPVLAGAGSPGSASWGSQLGQVAESTSTSSTNSASNNANGGAQEITIPSTNSRPKSSDFSGTVGSPRPEAGDSWASMVNTPLIPMFSKTTSGAGGSASLGGTGLGVGSSGVPRMGDPTVHRRVPKASSPSANNNRDANGGPGEIYDDNGNLISQNQNATQNKRNANAWGSGAGGARSPALSNTSSHQNPNANDILAMQMGMNPGAFGMGLGGLNMGALSPGLGVPGMGLGGMGVGGMPFNLNLLNAMGISPEAQAQILAAQMAQAQAQMGGGFNPALGLGMQQNARRAPSARSASNSAQNAGSNSTAGNKSSTPSAPSDIDPALLNDVPAWLRSLRLHKYTPNFQGMNWEDIVMLNEDELEAKGVAALGARRKMIKTFELVRKRMGMGEITNGQSA
ncbi:sam domain protein [Moniliophthora roreri MCA 2997]|uniref:RNA-binding protein VTS1 n=2 Tax=Moniliophthora roreri TaxID=221103 RepID=V2X920_MONRO|nr:sam domain protein [Moniliophthora roreri MCA 2997]KAI3621202.1 sam domain protein [Moniliophthora roreri]